MFNKRKIEEFRIFFCWQSDIPGQREMIFEELQAQKYRLEEVNRCHIEIDEDMRSVAGMIPIAHTVLKKIKDADIFVCDISPVASICSKDSYDNNIYYREKKMPNSNVMLELGYALGCMHPSRIIALANTNGHKWHDGEMPFDIFERYYVKFTCKENLDLSRHLDLSLKFLREYGRVDANGKNWRSRLIRFIDRIKGNVQINVPSNTEIRDISDSERLFSDRMALAFPGVTSKYYSSSEAIKRLKVFFADDSVLNDKRFILEEEYGGYLSPIDCFEVISNEIVLLGQDIIKVGSIEVNRETTGQDQQIKISCMKIDPVKYDDSIQDNCDSTQLEQYYAEYEDEHGLTHFVTKQLHDDKSAFLVDGTWVSLDRKTKLRRISLIDTTMIITPYRKSVYEEWEYNHSRTP